MGGGEDGGGEEVFEEVGLFGFVEFPGGAGGVVETEVFERGGCV